MSDSLSSFYFFLSFPDEDDFFPTLAMSLSIPYALFFPQYND